jgi:hypothetical protein
MKALMNKVEKRRQMLGFYTQDVLKSHHHQSTSGPTKDGVDFSVYLALVITVKLKIRMVLQPERVGITLMIKFA